MLQNVNWSRVEQYLREKFNLMDETEELVIKPFTAGYSNLTYLLRIGQWEGVLRRPPFGKLPAKAHDMNREYNLLKKIYSVYPKAPKPLLYCEDHNIMDKPFYIMELKKGIVLDKQLPNQWDVLKIKKQISKSFIQELADLHRIDVYKSGLDSLGKPEGFLQRQVNGWINRYRQVRTEDLPFVEKLENWLIHNIPVSKEVTIIHNDFKLNNIVFNIENPNEIIAVLDWEMSTIGDPLLDLAISLAYWTEKEDEDTGLATITNQPGFMTRKELAILYAEVSGRDISNLNYYLSFSFYKIAAVLQQIYYRYKTEGIGDERFANLNIGVRNLMLQSDKAIHATIV
ncbi:aminoglycoside phosphotransferase (APT) family kinase protein [Anoxybacillus tepidamans]|uniref:Aminoglycoside phosphotransferase (APT) family kinase protein n=1 Tax=Anoxybacteroides tepidamans TaxID=265948 RepID=A0A7W8INT0_9BACL|nr:phosphotransferase family protein [Anoxybacillus tepidamans]MBB5323281.1 aminoglycoside phosphotransferase (APT) family kinase protein [Anoxybacillus tepidamans]